MRETAKPEVVLPTQPAGGDPLARVDDACLVRETLKGHDEAYEALVRRYMPMVIGFLYNRVPNTPDAEDIAQEAFFAAYRHLGRLRDPNCFPAWLLAITRAKLIDHCRKESRQVPLVETELFEGEAVPDPLNLAASREQDAFSLSSFSQTRSIILREIEQLNETYRMPLYWRLIGEESTAEIAERLGIRENTVRMRLFRGLRILKKSLRKRGFDPFSGESR